MKKIIVYVLGVFLLSGVAFGQTVPRCFDDEKDVMDGDFYVYVDVDAISASKLLEIIYDFTFSILDRSAVRMNVSSVSPTSGSLMMSVPFDFYGQQSRREMKNTVLTHLQNSVNKHRRYITNLHCNGVIRLL